MVVEPFDSSFVDPEDAATDPLVWTVLAWGSPRDLQLIRKLRRHPYCTIGELENQGRLRSWQWIQTQKPRTAKAERILRREEPSSVGGP